MRRPVALLSPTVGRGKRISEGLEELDFGEETPKSVKVLEGLGDWELHPSDVVLYDVLGCGATSKVCSGMWRGHPVAVKQLSHSLCAMVEKERECLCRELAILQSVCNSRVVRMYGVVPYNPVQIVMELCSGGSCFDLLHNSAHVLLTWDQKLKIAMDTAEGMYYLHGFDPPILHRDLKSLNLLLEFPVCTSDDVPSIKITDFGLSRLKDTTHRGAMTASVGTTHWMAPEVMLLGCQYDEKVDVYSYGIILYEVACRALPFDDISRKLEIAQRVKDGMRPSLDAMPPGCPTALKSLIQLCWHQDPFQRPDFGHVARYLGIAEAESDSSPF